MTDASATSTASTGLLPALSVLPQQTANSAQLAAAYAALPPLCQPRSLFHVSLYSYFHIAYI